MNLETHMMAYGEALDSAGNPTMGLIVQGSYSSYSVYALNATTGAKVWETYLQPQVAMLDALEMACCGLVARASTKLA